ncbi:MAG: hypothetical protein DWQ10_11390, partial [Calditrichaeota bacterium]
MKKFIKWFSISVVGVLIIVVAIAAITLVRYNRFGLYPSGGVLSENQKAFDITSYDISITPDATEKSITAKTIVSLRSLKDGLDEIQLQLINNFEIQEIATDAKNVLDFKHEDGLITIQLA